MKTLLKILKWFGIVLIVVIMGFVITVYALQNKKYEAPFPDIHASTDSAPFRRMSDHELLAIWKYLRSLTPIENETGPYKQFAKK